MKSSHPLSLLIGLVLAAASLPEARAAQPPLDLGNEHASTPGAPNYANACVTLADGTLESFFRRGNSDGVFIFRVRSTDHARTWSAPESIVKLEPGGWGGPMPLLDQDGEVHFVIPKLRGEGRKPAVDRFLDLWHLRSTSQRTQWSEPVRIFEGYVGAQQGVFQLTNGRILVPFAEWLPGVPTAPPSGPSVTTCVYSNDGGKTWLRSGAKLTAPCHEGYNGSNYGACEPTLIELKDGRVWMLIRTQDGYLYESYSPDGIEWSEAKRSRFPSSNSPAFPIRLADGRMVLFWNNCVMPPRVGEDGVYGGRDALHAAISTDEGQSWSGFREVYADPTRNASPPKSGDRGTAYPHATVTHEGKILLVSGQGASLRRRFLIDPEWLLEKEFEHSFDSLDAWHVFKSFGRPARYWRDRTQGPQLIPHPDTPDKQVLHIRRPDDRDADGAALNFPAGSRGRMTLRLRAQPGFAGATVALTDRYFDPSDDNGEKLAVFAWKLDVEPGQWHTVELAWDLANQRCAVQIDGKAAGTLEAKRAAPNGLSYLRLRSTAPAVDTAGVLIESVKGQIE
jgi:hypothetical protein